MPNAPIGGPAFLQQAVAAATANSTTAPLASPVTPSFPDVSDTASVASGAGSVFSSFSQVGGVPLLYHVGGGKFRQRLPTDGDTEAEPFSFDQAMGAIRVPFSLGAMMKMVDIQCDSPETAATMKHWMQLHVDNSQHTSMLGSKYGAHKKSTTASSVTRSGV